MVVYFNVIVMFLLVGGCVMMKEINVIGMM